MIGVNEVDTEVLGSCKLCCVNWKEENYQITPLIKVSQPFNFHIKCEIQTAKDLRWYGLDWTKKKEKKVEWHGKSLKSTDSNVGCVGRGCKMKIMTCVPIMPNKKKKDQYDTIRWHVK